MPATHTGKLTYADYARIPDDGLRHEIIDGGHYVSPSPSERHQRASGALFSLLWHHVRTHRLGRVYAAPFDVLLGAHDVVEPDIIFVSNTRADIVGEDNIQGAPDLLIEVLSPSHRKRDQTVKRARYDALGVTEYWLVDPDAEQISVLRRDAGGLTAAGVYGSDASVTSPLLPGLTITVADVFAP
ncbi:MAG TPA: Uma2 family endonuclease [Terriglobales bacterium]|nr:Uma2 family endonuclease [Terriglobales bacterium]